MGIHPWGQNGTLTTVADPIRYRFSGYDGIDPHTFVGGFATGGPIEAAAVGSRTEGLAETLTGSSNTFMACKPVTGGPGDGGVVTTLDDASTLTDTDASEHTFFAEGD
jgi:hypothetical protein